MKITTADAMTADELISNDWREPIPERIDFERDEDGSTALFAVFKYAQKPTVLTGECGMGGPGEFANQMLRHAPDLLRRAKKLMSDNDNLFAQLQQAKAIAKDRADRCDELQAKIDVLTQKLNTRKSPSPTTPTGEVKEFNT